MSHDQTAEQGAEAMKRNPYLKVTRPDTHGDQSCTYKWPGECLIENELDDAEIGESIRIELVDMTDEEFEALGDFEGW